MVDEASMVDVMLMQALMKAMPDNAALLGKCFWPLIQEETCDIEKLLADKDVHRLANRLRTRDDHEEVKLVDAAY